MAFEMQNLRSEIYPRGDLPVSTGKRSKRFPSGRLPRLPLPRLHGQLPGSRSTVYPSADS